MDISRVKVESVPVKTRLETDADLSIGLAGNLDTHRTAKRDHPLIDDAVINLYAFTTLAYHASLVKRIQVLGHIGLGGVDFGQQLTDVFFGIAQRTDDAQPHGRRHHPKHLCGFFKDFFRVSQDAVVNWGFGGHGLASNGVGMDFAQLSNIQAMFLFLGQPSQARL
jgi:hypothetical protein